MKKFTIFMLILLYAALNAKLQADNIEVHLRADTNQGLIGDHIKLHIELKYDKNLHVIWPQIPDSIGKIEFLNKSKIDTLDSGKVGSMRQTLIISSFDSGQVVIPPFTFMYEKKGFQEPFPLQTESLYIKFFGIQVDTSKAYKDIKPPLKESLIWSDLLPYFGILLGIAALVIIIFYLIKHFRKKEQKLDLKYDPSIPAHIMALEALHQLDSEKLWQKGHVKHYYIRLTDIIRLYIERQMGFPALEMVTEDIEQNLSKTQVEMKLINKFSSMLRSADLVKFAKLQPLPDENSMAMKICIEFIDLTKTDNPMQE
ncbi:MAG: hypothetical protein NT007_14990 [Candidatus Kapabacteria bacterium]|nr:hypothetical protein [Candidatus Kapabacteria bacterium]